MEYIKFNIQDSWVLYYKIWLFTTKLLYNSLITYIKHNLD